MKFVFLLKSLLILSLLKLVINNLMKHEKKQHKQRCRWQIIGSECDIGMECSKFYGICLKKEGEYCINDSDCDDDDCDRNRCD